MLSTLSNLSNHFYRCNKSRTREWGGAPPSPAQLRPLTFQGCSSDNRKVCVGPSVFVNLRPAALASYHDNHETAHRQHHPTLLLLSPAAKTPPQIFLMNKELFSVDTSRQTQLFPAAHVGDGEISSSTIKLKDYVSTTYTQTLWHK